MPEEKPKPGPKPETLRIEEGEVDWKDALKHAMDKPADNPFPGGKRVSLEEVAKVAGKPLSLVKKRVQSENIRTEQRAGKVVLRGYEANSLIKRLGS